MADNEQDTPQTPTEGQGTQVPAQATEQPAQETASQAVSADNLAPLPNESLEAYAARVRGEVSWRDRQLTQQHKRIKERDDRLAKIQEIEVENARLKELAQSGTRPPGQEPPKPAPTTTPAQPTPQVGQDAIAQARFQIGMENTQEALLRDYPQDWAIAHSNLQKAGGIDPGIMNAVLDTDDPAYVLVTLGKDMNRYTQIMEMSEGRRRAALIKIGMEKSQKPAEPAKALPRPSAAPAPTQGLPAGSAAPVEGAIVPDQDDRAPIPPPGQFAQDKYRSDQYDAAWYAARRQQKLNSQGRAWSPGKR